jgi:hypothetical protein
LAHGPIVATDTAFSSNRFARADQIHKLDLQAELEEAEMKVFVFESAVAGVFAHYNFLRRWSTR